MENKKEEPRLVTVPDIASSQLIKLVQDKLDLTYMNPGIATRDFMKDVGGKTYEHAVWAPRVLITDAEVRAHFAQLHFEGNCAAFLCWLMQGYEVDAYYVTVLDDIHLAFDSGEENDGYTLFRNLCMFTDSLSLGRHCRFVAFREVK